MEEPSKAFINVRPTQVVKRTCSWFPCDCRVQIKSLAPAWASVPLGHDMRVEMVGQVAVKRDIDFVSSARFGHNIGKAADGFEELASLRWHEFEKLANMPRRHQNAASWVLAVDQ